MVADDESQPLTTLSGDAASVKTQKNVEEESQRQRKLTVRSSEYAEGSRKQRSVMADGGNRDITLPYRSESAKTQKRSMVASSETPAATLGEAIGIARCNIAQSWKSTQMESTDNFPKCHFSSSNSDDGHCGMDIFVIYSSWSFVALA